MRVGSWGGGGRGEGVEFGMGLGGCYGIDGEDGGAGGGSGSLGAITYYSHGRSRVEQRRSRSSVTIEDDLLTYGNP